MHTILLVYILVILLSIKICAISDEWDIAEVELVSTEIKKAGSDHDKAASLRRSGLRLEFTSMGKKFSMEISLNKHLLSRNLSSQTRGQPLVGTNLQVTEEDGTMSFVRNPLARAEQLIVYGAVEYKGNIYRLTADDHPLLSEDIGRKARSKRPPNSSSKNVVIKREIGKVSESLEGVKYRCGTEKLSFNIRQSGTAANLFTGNSKRARDESLKLMTQSSSGARNINDGCLANPHQLVVGVVADCNYIKALGGRTKARDNVLNDMNLVSGIFFKSYNIDITVSSVELLDRCDSNKESFNVHCKDYPGIDLALNRFSDWRNDRSEEAGIYHLVTSCNYSDTVGLAWLNQVCRTKSFTDSNGEVVSGTSISVLVPNHFSVIAHELAHNLGAIHDCNTETCNGSCTDYLQCQCCPCDGCNCRAAFIMEPENAGLDATQFSTCTINDVCDKLPYLGSCLKQQGTAGEDLTAVCGNGIKEGKEECDCGDEKACANHPCCTPDCKLKENAKCSDNNDICCEDCQVIPADAKQVCKTSTSLCQMDAVCDGQDSNCPAPKSRPDGIVCDDGKKCASGLCTSRDTQCSIFGRHLNITEACQYSKRSCGIICQGIDQCIDMSANYIDGTPCGEGGLCIGGMCSEFGSSSNRNGTQLYLAFCSSISVAYPIGWMTLVLKTVISIIDYITFFL